jgi:hypothetical protein
MMRMVDSLYFVSICSVKVVIHLQLMKNSMEPHGDETFGSENH